MYRYRIMLVADKKPLSVEESDLFDKKVRLLKNYDG